MTEPPLETLPQPSVRSPKASEDFRQGARGKPDRLYRPGFSDEAAQLGDVRRAHFATAADNGGAGIQPASRVLGIARRGQFFAAGGHVGAVRDLESRANRTEPVGVGAKRTPCVFGMTRIEFKRAARRPTDPGFILPASRWTGSGP